LILAIGQTSPWAPAPARSQWTIPSQWDLAALPPEPPLPSVPAPKPDSFPHYDDVPKRGLLATFSGVTPRKIAGLASCRTEGLPGTDGPCIVVSRDNIWVETLPATASDEQIRRAAGLEVRRSALPFVQRAIARRDDRVWRRVSVLLGMKPYRRARFTQSIFTLSGRRVTQPVLRTELDEKWNIPGGLVGIKGWQSELYRSVPSVDVKKGFISVLNGFTARDFDGSIYAVRQDEVGWKRNYADGTMFADVLSTDRGVFEVRLAEKQGGKWERYVAWSDADAAPQGYVRPRRAECAACHDQAGTGSYGAALIPGGDTVLSEPFENLE